MTRVEARTRLKYYLNQAGSDTRFDPEGSGIRLNTWLEDANREVWLEACRLDRSRFRSEKDWTWTANTVSYDLVTQLTEEAYRVLKVYHTEAAGAISATNRVLDQILPLPATEREDVYLGGKQPAVGFRYYYTIEGDTLFLAPIPASAMYVHVVYLPQAPTLAADANVLLSLPSALTAPRLVDHHEYVVLRAAMRALASVSQENAPLRQLLDEKRAAFLDDLSAGRQDQTTDYIQDPYSADEAAYW